MQSDESDQVASPQLAERSEVTLLERALPFAALSLVINADRRAHDPVYGAHRWWARRPPALLRAVLLAAALPAEVPTDHFWQLYASDRRTLSGWRVHDPFMGGGSTLVEAARLGAVVSGGDVDPLAVDIVRYELAPAPAADVRQAGALLLKHLKATCGHLYPGRQDRQPLHYFWLHEVTCPSCESTGLLYRDLVLARDRRKPGAVVRDRPLTVFCPEDLSVHDLARADRRQLRHNARAWPINAGTFQGQRYSCPHCGATATHRELATGRAPRRLVAVEETEVGQRRRIRGASSTDRCAIEQAAAWVAKYRHELVLPTAVLSDARHDERPLSYGITCAAELFTDRQLAVLGTALRWLVDADLSHEVRAGLRLAISNALATNNKLCSYAYDYGRLSALFSVRGYSLPALPVELNPLHADSGRGTLYQCIERVARAGSGQVRRYTWSPKRQAIAVAALDLPTHADNTDVRCATAFDPSSTAQSVDLCVFDPPYFDYIAYPELSEFYRAWLGTPDLSGTPLLPGGEDPGESFGLGFGVALRAALARLAPGRPTAFTYHSTNPEAWRAVGIGLDEAKVRVTALWPIRSDGHMGHHSHPGNCEWDLLMVCRRVSETIPRSPAFDVDSWAHTAQPLKIGYADRTSMELAITTAASRFGTVAEEPKA